MSTERITEGWCRVCGQPVINEGFGWYHRDRSLGTVRDLPPHFAKVVA